MSCAADILHLDNELIKLEQQEKIMLRDSVESVCSLSGKLNELRREKINVMELEGPEREEKLTNIDGETRKLWEELIQLEKDRAEIACQYKEAKEDIKTRRYEEIIKIQNRLIGSGMK